MTILIIVCLAVLAAAGLGLACMSIDEPAKTSPARARPLLAFQSGPGKRSALSILLALHVREQEPLGSDLPEPMRIRDYWARGSGTTSARRRPLSTTPCWTSWQASRTRQSSSGSRHEYRR